MDGSVFVLHISLMHWDRLPSAFRKVGRPFLYQCERSWSWKNPKFEDFDLWIVLGGEGWIAVNGAVRERVVRGQGFLLRPGDAVLGGHDPARPLRVFALHFDVTAPWRKLLSQAVPRRLCFHDPVRAESQITAILALREGEPDWSRGLVRVHLASLLAIAANDARTSAPDQVDRKLQQLAQDIAARPGLDWTAEPLARKSGLSLSHFNRRFRRIAGDSLARYVIVRRTDRARKLLRETPMTLAEIADALGYADIFYFQRQFRAETGTTPGRYRSQRNEGRSLGPPG